jgi:hypothetical protein
VAEVVKLAALTPLNVTAVAPVKFVPLIVTLAPTGPLVGVKLVIVGGGACTVSVVLPATLLSVAAMVVLPGLPAVARPVLLIVATLVFEDVHVAWLVRFCVLPSE